MALAAEKKQQRRSKIADAISTHSSGRNSGKLGKVSRKHRPKSYKAPKYKFPKHGVKRGIQNSKKR